MNESFTYGGHVYSTLRQAALAAVADYIYSTGFAGYTSEEQVTAMWPDQVTSDMEECDWPIPGGLYDAWCPDDIIGMAAEIIAKAKKSLEEDAKDRFLWDAESLETSKEIMEAIWAFSNRTEAGAMCVWFAPTYDQKLAIWERVTNNGKRQASDFCWGAAGAKWAVQLGIETEETADDDEMVKMKILEK